MALINCNFYSEALEVGTTVTVILPENAGGQVGIDGNEESGKPSVLYLLHGLTDDQTIWQRMTSIERYVSSMNLAVIMPTTGRGFYTDMKEGYRYWQFISEELPDKMQSFFNVSTKREDTFVAGLSMGGYGAIKLMLSKPDKFCVGATLSGAVDLASLYYTRDTLSVEELQRIVGTKEELVGSENDLFHLIEELKKNNIDIPKIYSVCGKDDVLCLGGNRNFKNFCIDNGVDIEYYEHEGDHNWEFWDRYIQDVLEWLPIRKEGKNV